MAEFVSTGLRVTSGRDSGTRALYEKEMRSLPLLEITTFCPLAQIIIINRRLGMEINAASASVATSISLLGGCEGRHRSAWRTTNKTRTNIRSVADRRTGCTLLPPCSTHPRRGLHFFCYGPVAAFAVSCLPLKISNFFPHFSLHQTYFSSSSLILH